MLMIQKRYRNWWLIFQFVYFCVLPIQVAALVKEWVCGGYLAGIAGSIFTGGMEVCLS
jgi:hypothetical protein